MLPSTPDRFHVRRSRANLACAALLVAASVVLLLSMLAIPVIPVLVWRLTQGAPDLWWWIAVFVVVLACRRLNLRDRVAVVAAEPHGLRINNKLVATDITFAKLACRAGSSLVVEGRGGSLRLYEGQQIRISGDDASIARLESSLAGAAVARTTTFRLLRGSAWQSAAMLFPIMLIGCTFASIERLGFPLHTVIVVPWALAATAVQRLAFGTTIVLKDAGMSVKMFGRRDDIAYEEIEKIQCDGSRLVLTMKSGKVKRLGRAPSPYELDYAHEMRIGMEVLHASIVARLHARDRAHS